MFVQFWWNDTFFRGNSMEFFNKLPFTREKCSTAIFCVFCRNQLFGLLRVQWGVVFFIHSIFHLETWMCEFNRNDLIECIFIPDLNDQAQFLRDNKQIYVKTKKNNRMRTSMCVISSDLIHANCASCWTCVYVTNTTISVKSQKNIIYPYSQTIAKQWCKGESEKLSNNMNVGVRLRLFKIENRTGNISTLGFDDHSFLFILL